MSAPTFAATPVSIERDLLGDFVHVVEEAAIASTRTMGQGDAKAADQAAVHAMRNAFEAIHMAGNIVIGEGERDKAPMLYIGEPVGAKAPDGIQFPRVDIAVDPLEGTNLCAQGTPNSMCVLAAAEPGGLLHAPDCYMQKIIAGPACRDALDIDAPVKYNLKAIAHCLDRQVKDLVIMVLDRPRHEELISQIRGGRCADSPDSGRRSFRWYRRGRARRRRPRGFRHGGRSGGRADRGRAALLSGEMVARLEINTKELEERVERMGIRDPKRVYTARDLAPGDQIIFAACGVTDGALLHGVRFFGDGCRTHTLAMTYASRQVRFIDTVHMFREPGNRGVRLY